MTAYIDRVLHAEAQTQLLRRASPSGAGAVLVLQATPGADMAWVQQRLQHAFDLRDRLDARWAATPLHLSLQADAPSLTLDDPGGEPLPAGLAGPWPVAEALQAAAALAHALARLHAAGLVHGELQPGHALWQAERARVWLTGLCGARPWQGGPELEAGAPDPAALPYMAPERAGRIRRPVDVRSDLYSLGAIVYELLTGRRPFDDAEAAALVRAHLARLPAAPHARTPGVPQLLSNLVLKLLAKAPEDRYQTAAGVAADLEHCASELTPDGRIAPFPLGASDVAMRLPPAARLHGRARERAALRAAFDRVADGGRSALVLVGGPAGSGKSSLVRDLQRSLPRQAGLFAAGKFDQFQRDPPYATLAQALQGLTAMVLAQPAEQLPAWQARLRAAVDTSGAQMLSLVPQLEMVIGPQAGAAALAPRNAQAHMQRVLQRVLQAFATPERPLVLFLDDLQWADAPTLQLVEHLLSAPPVQHLLLLGAWRDQEAAADHPLRDLAARLDDGGTRVQEIALRPLRADDTAAIVAEMLNATREDSAALAEQVHGRAGGNPLFARQWLTELAERGLLVEDAAHGGRWQWALDRIAAGTAAGSLPDLVAQRLQRLPAATQHALRQLACVGMESDLGTLKAATQLPPAALDEALRPALQAALVRRHGPRCAFAHDRVREAAYALLTEPERARSHLRIAQHLRATRSPAEQLAHVFAITDQLNRGVAAMAGGAERERAAELNLLAARRARLSAAYSAVQHHVEAGIALLGPGSWERCHALSFELHRLRAECGLLVGDLPEAEATLTQLLGQAQTPVDQAGVYRLLVVLHSVRSAYALAVDHALRALALFDLAMPAHPTRQEVEAAHAQVQQLLGERGADTLLALPRATDRAAEAAMDVLSELFAPACFTDEHLAQLHLCRMVALSLRHGVTEASAQGVAWYGIMLGHHQGRHGEAWRFTHVARALVERHHLRALEAKSLFALEIVSPWVQPLHHALRLSRAAFTAGTEGGDVMVACFACHHTVTNMLVAGTPLPQVRQEIETGLAIVRKAGFEDVADELVTQQRFVLALCGETPGLADWNGAPFDAQAFEAALLRPGRMPTMVFWYWLLRAQSHFFAGQAADALACLDRAQGWAWSSPVHIQFVHHAFFGALSLAALEHAAPTPDPARRTRIAALRERLAHWHAQCPVNFADKLTLVDAEIARLQGRPLDAAPLYQRAADLARGQGCTHNEALAHELAAHLLAAMGLSTASEAHWRQAHGAWQRWGAVGKVRQIEQALFFLQPPPPAVLAAPATGELADMLRVSQRLSGEIQRDRLVATLLTLAVEQAGADRGQLLLLHEGLWAVEASARVGGGGVAVDTRRGAPREGDIPAGLLQHVARSHARVLLDDMASAALLPFAPPENRGALHSVLCQPLLRQGGLVGVLYLENRLAPGVFTPERLTLLELLAAQAAISLENARLYEDLQRENRERQDAERESARVQAALMESEQRFRRMADATPDVLWITELVPERVVYVSPSFERVWGRTAEALYRDPRLWTQSIHDDDREGVEHAFGQWVGSGAAQPWAFEFRVVQPGGAVRWIHERGVMISDGATRRVTGLSTDITERKLAEAALRESESRFALAVAGANDGIWDWDIVRDQLFISERAQRLYGLEPSAPVRSRAGWVAAVRQHPEDQALRNQRMRAYLLGEAPGYDGEYRVLYPDGLYHWLRIRGQCVRDASGRATRLAGSVSDIDAHKRAEAALRQSQRLEAVGTLAGGIAHDFNNILGAILGFGEMALRGTRAGSRTRRDIGFIMTAGERGRALVERILAFSRTGLSARVPVHVEGVAQESLQLLAATLPATVQLRQRLAAGHATILGDATQLHQVLMNLLGNALQAMPGGGVLQLELAPRQLAQPHLASTGPLPAGDYVALSVADSGCGIAPEHLARIFDPFFTTREAGAGTGLGLSLVHGIVAEFGGAVDVQSTPGAGSRFTVLLPRLGEAAAAPPDTPPGAPPRGQHEQVLVVDDEPALLQLATRRLSDLGYVPVPFASAAEALAAFSAHPERFDAVLTDERMPGMSGTALVPALRAIRPLLPIVLLTGYRGADVVERARSAGVDAVLGKPLAHEDLARTLAEVLAAARAQP